MTYEQIPANPLKPKESNHLTSRRFRTRNCRYTESLPADVQNLGRPGSAHPAYAQRADLQQRLEGPYPSSRLDLHFRRRVPAHECEVGMRRPTRSVARRRLHPIDPDAGANLAQPDLRLIVEVSVLEDHLDLGAMCVRRFSEEANLAFDILPVAAARLADVDHHVEFGGSVFQR